MKSTSKVFWIVAGIVMAVIGACVFLALYTDNPIRFAGKALRIKIPAGTTVLVDDYSEPSFPTGDGYSWTVLQVPSERIDKFSGLLASSPDWKPLPLPVELAEHERYLQPTLMLDAENGEIPIESATGYYIFIDEQKEERQNSETMKPFYERSSFNYRFGLFNDKDGKLYIWSIDT